MLEQQRLVIFLGNHIPGFYRYSPETKENPKNTKENNELEPMT